MAHACSIARETMDAVAPLVVPGTSMVDLVEAVEHELGPAARAAVVPDPHLHLGRAPARLRRRGCARGLREGEVVLFDFGAVWQGYCSDFGRTVPCGEPPAEYERVTRCCSTRRRPDARRRFRARSRATSTPPAAPDRGGRARRRLPPPDGARDRARHPRTPLPLRRGRDAARGRDDVHRRALDPPRRPLRVRVEDVIVVTESGGRML